MSFSDLDPAVATRVLREIGREFLGASRAAAAVREQIADFLARHGTEHPPPSILLRGECGVGKSLLARLIHRAGPRPAGPFVDVNCAAIPETILDLELYGYERGFFTDARHDKPGALRTANRGTIFLNEVGLLPVYLQPTLMKVLQEKPSIRRGDEPLDVWTIAATSEDLRAAVQYRRFREDLYQHLGQLDLLIPPLRQRPEDILLLAEHSLARVCAEHHLSPKVFAADARSALLAYGWPGNVREVDHLMKRVAVRFAKKNIITAAMLALPNW
jgi:transcriptional regulator with GAF, ATPase, and Fis domain